ncbi:ATP phosphoribosyltransferase regulatory subunit, partial [bacterium]|nr:ATP phosphoribosyltransferase regulatory subunit [bacterium]
MEKLTTYFENYKDKLSLDSINRLYKNPLRILDDKIDGKLDFVKSAPKLKEFLTSDDNECFNNILKALQQEQISYIIDDSLVRGLDYYTGLVFEFVYMNLDGEELTLI